MLFRVEIPVRLAAGAWYWYYHHRHLHRKKLAESIQAVLIL